MSFSYYKVHVTDDHTDVYRRLAQIRQDHNDQTIDINLNEGDGPAAIGANGAEAPAIAQYVRVGGLPHTNSPTLNIYGGFAGFRDILDEAPGQNWQGQLDRFQATRQGVILHEVR